MNSRRPFSLQWEGMNSFSTTTLTDLEKLIHELKGQISREAAQENVLTRIRIASLSDMERRLQDIRRLTSRQKIKLAFIGPVGAGKTTIICDLLGLQVADGRSDEGTFRKVLTAASGRTTACEVQILVRDEVRIDVSYPDPAEMEVTIENFGWYLWKDAGKEAPEETDFPASEVQKVLRNLLNLKKNITTKKDAGKDLALEFDDFDDFYDALLERYGAEERTETELVYEGEASRALAWIADHFKKLNLGTLPGFSLPNSIRISVPSSLLHIPEDFQVDAIIDTKGLEHADSIREDVDEYVRQGDAICIFVNRFNDAPNQVLPVLKRLLTSDAIDREQRCALIVNTSVAEATATADDDGDYVSEEEGIQIKGEQVKAAFAAAGVNRFLQENVHFHDPHRHFDVQAEKLSLKRGKEVTHVRENAGRLWSWIGDLVLRQDEYFRDEVGELKKRLDALERGGVLDAHDMAQLELASHTIGRIASEAVDARGSHRDFVRSLRRFHVSTFRAINNRYGVYNGNDIYYQAGEVTEQSFRGVTGRAKEEVEKTLQDLRAQVHNDALKQALVQYLAKLNADYLASTEMVRVRARQTVEQLIHPQFAPGSSDTFWRSVIGRWGGGPGYTDDVLAMYLSAVSTMESENGTVYRSAWNRATSQLEENLRLS